MKTLLSRMRRSLKCSASSLCAVRSICSVRSVRSMATALTLALALAGASLLQAGVTDLPVRRIGNKNYYCYEVKNKETLYSIARKLDVSQDLIIKYNPTAYDGLKGNSALFFPVDAFPAPESTADAPRAGGSGSSPAKGSASTASGKTHKVMRGETLYGISKQYDITVEELMDANPVTRSGLKAGMVLAIPATVASGKEPALAATTPAKTPDAAPATKPAAPTTPTTPTTPAKPVTPAVPGKDNDVTAEKPSKHPDINVALLLPLDLDAAKRDRRATTALEFYKGFLMAVDTLREFDRPIHVTVYDVATPALLAKALADPKLKKAQAIVAPDESTGLAEVGTFGRDNGVSVVNVFGVRDSSWRQNPSMMQTNVPHATLYSKALDGFLKRYKGYTPVLLKPRDAADNALAGSFTSRLISRLTAAGKAPVTITYSGSLAAADLESLDPTTDYVFIPWPGSQRDLNRVLPALVDLKEKYAGDVTLFGQPEYITYRGETRDNLHKLGATFHSRFVDDPADRYTELLLRNYTSWYGSPMSDLLPRPGVLGFDTGLFLLRALKQTDGTLDHDLPSYQGVQNGFRMRRQQGGGWVNDRVFLVTLLPSGIVDSHEL